MKTYLTIFILAVLLMMTKLDISSPQQKEIVQKNTPIITEEKPVEEKKPDITTSVQKKTSKEKIPEQATPQEQKPKEKPKTESQKSQTTQKSKKSEEKKATVKSYFNATQEQKLRSSFVTLINQQRNHSVVLSSTLLQSSTLRAQEASRKWSHTRPNGRKWNSTLQGVIDIKRVRHGENLAQTQISFQENYSDDELDQLALTLHNGLINSSTHYAVMTNSNYKKVNIGIYTQLKENQLIITIAQHYTE